MCVATLHFSTQPCAHGWHELLLPCRPDNNLQNCKDKLKLEGWASKTDDCPWCDADASTTTATHKLLGGNSSACSSTPSSPTIPPLGNTTPKRTDSFGTPLSRQSSAGSTESERGQHHRAMNQRVNTYLTSHHYEVLPSAAKNSPTYSGRQSMDVQQQQPQLERSNSRRFSGISGMMSRSGRLRRKMNMTVLGF